MTLIHVDDSLPGITRRRAGRAWAYHDAEGSRISERDEIDRLNAIALPPAYVDCWFSPAPNGHILATGFDARGRKQYRYHPDFRAAREAEKYEATRAFGAKLPLLRKRLSEDLAVRQVVRETSIAAVVRLLDLGALRIGNEQYAKANRSFGATTLRRRHAELTGQTLKLRFKAKSGKERRVAISDRVLARVVRRLTDLPGQHLFQYPDEEGDGACPVTSADVNAYIRETMGGPFSAKNFRTWAASVHAFELLAGAKARLGLKPMLDLVADRLGNTPTIARKSYVHPALIDLAKDGQEDWRAGLRLPRRTQWLSREERGLILFLEERGAD